MSGQRTSLEKAGGPQGWLVVFFAGTAMGLLASFRVLDDPLWRAFKVAAPWLIAVVLLVGLAMVARALGGRS